jgi:hypothetical protein
MAGTTVNVFRSTDAGAPVLSAAQGTVINVLDACLINGYNSKTITITRTGQTATASCTSHGYALDGATKVRISGAGQAEYNGDFTIFNVTTNTFDFTVTGSPASPATGTITSIVAPLDWSKPFSSTGLAAYRSNAVTGTRLYLRINDNNPDANTYQTARMIGYESMSDINTGLAPFPTTAQISGGLWISKSYNASGVAVPWVLIGDGYSFYFFNVPYLTSYSGYRIYHFGDIASFKQSDPYGCFIAGDLANATLQAPEGSSNIVATSTQTTLVDSAQGRYLARAYTNLGGSIITLLQGNYTLGGTVSGYSGVVPFPNPCNNGYYLSPFYLSEASCLRGKLGGMWQTLQIRPFNASNVIIPASQNSVGRRLLILQTGGVSTTYGERAFDIDGPWR